MSTRPDLHVVSLRYSLRPSDRITYACPPPVEFDTEEARLRLDEGKLTCDMKVHLQTEKEARAVVEPILKAWEVAADLESSKGALRFQFEKADIIDRSPAPPEVIRGHGTLLSGVASSTGEGTVSVQVTYAHYPDPPSTFRLNPDAESTFRRYQGYLAGREPLLAMAYFCLTVIESRAGGREHAARVYSIDKEVLRKVGELTSERGDHMIARKATSGPAQPLTGPESEWIEAAVKALIWRLGDTRDKAALPKITLDSLPTLHRADT